MTKKPRIAVAPAVVKRPATKVQDPDIVKNEPVSWGFQWLDQHGEWGWRKLHPDHFEELHEELKKLEGETLHDLLRSKRVKDIPVAHMERPAQERLKTLHLEEADTLWELRMPKKWRAWGLVEGSVFYLLWWDENETACGPPPKGKKRR